MIYENNLQKKENKYKSLVRFTTAGSIDDGKSTLIGRLMFDSKSIFEDQLEHITMSGKRPGKEEIDLSLLTDGLRAEREQGITIDVTSGTFNTGDEIIVLPALIKSKIVSRTTMNNSLQKATAGDSVSISLEDQIDISRGDIIIKSGDPIQSSQKIDIMVCWFNEKPLKTGHKYLIRHHTCETSCIIDSVNYKMDIEKLEEDTMDIKVRMNDIASISIKTSKPLFYDSYKMNNITGSMILIDEGTNETPGAGMIC